MSDPCTNTAEIAKTDELSERTKKNQMKKKSISSAQFSSSPRISYRGRQPESEGMSHPCTNTAEIAKTDELERKNVIYLRLPNPFTTTYVTYQK
ncbi:hypothetical protein CDAR_164961 [Caerostris darwini]|uniref:Uncharacterized protein n=1 Tax=Caerostris darwini TaxID=1538125 RepID=A0AAV4VQH3_9ARAC|nr:hypothetical protein CDAR_164961 [Caerostris darwini]